MAARTRIALAFLITGMTLATAPVMGAEPDTDMRAGASFIVRAETHMAKRDQKGYCKALHDWPDYASRESSCKAAVAKNTKKAGDCAEANIKQQMTKNTDRCLALSAKEFETQIGIERREWDQSVQRMKKNGVDVEKLLREERAKLR